MKASPLARAVGLSVDDGGRAWVDASLRALGQGDVFVVGDSARVKGHDLRMGCVVPLPMAIQVADQIVARVAGGTAPPFRFGFAIQCIGLGPRAGLVEWVGPDDAPRERALSGRVCWLHQGGHLSLRGRPPCARGSCGCGCGLVEVDGAARARHPAVAGVSAGCTSAGARMSDAAGPSDAATRFGAQHGYLFAIAYRMLGSRTEAEDVLQDAWLRFSAADRTEVSSDRAYLATIVSRLCLDRMTSAAGRRESYVGPWLPEPLRAEPDDAPRADDRLSLAESVSMALLRTLESLSPMERAVLLLREVFEFPYEDLAAMLQTSPESCRQHLHRARQRLREHPGPRRRPSREQQTRLGNAFLAAVQAGDTQALAALLTEDACVVSDGGGAAPAARKAVLGREAVARFLLGISRKGGGVGGGSDGGGATYESTWLSRHRSFRCAMGGACERIRAPSAMLRSEFDARTSGGMLADRHGGSLVLGRR
jgi:RNA polymerase sigma-70 factor (ECF subfamily)